VHAAVQSIKCVPLTHTLLTAESVLWANTFLAAGSAVELVKCTGPRRTVMNTSRRETTVGLLDLEINNLTKILCLVKLAFSVVLVVPNGFRARRTYIIMPRMSIDGTP